MDKVLGMGNALVDVMTIISSDEILATLGLPKGSMQLVDDQLSNRVLENTKHLKSVIASGGSAANTIHGIAKLGVETGFIGKVGKDEMGNLFKSDLENSNLKPLLLESSTASGKAIAFVSPDSERTFATYLGAAVELSASDLTPEMFQGYQYFHIEGYLVQNHDLIETAVKLAKKQGLKVSLDLAAFNVVEANLTFLQHIIKNYVDIVFANEDEAKAFTGSEPFAAVDQIAEICEIAVVKVGKKGSLIKTNNQLTQVGIIDVNSIDTTGAGDLYAAGFLTGLIKGKTTEECGKMGALLAGKVIENLGAKISEANWSFIFAHLK
jgi:sugar/nucleoside kinase (ribokinase family)